MTVNYIKLIPKTLLHGFKELSYFLVNTQSQRHRNNAHLGSRKIHETNRNKQTRHWHVDVRRVSCWPPKKAGEQTWSVVYFLFLWVPYCCCCCSYSHTHKFLPCICIMNFFIMNLSRNCTQWCFSLLLPSQVSLFPQTL